MTLEQTRKCLMCDGLDYQCNLYTPKQNELCVWYCVIEHDLEKISQGNMCITFSHLIDLLRGEELKNKTNERR